MRILKVKGTNKNFAHMCRELENFQFSLLPGLDKTDYSLTNDLDKIIGYIIFDKSEPIASMGIKNLNGNTCELVRVFVCEK